MRIRCEPHPSLDVGAFITEFHMPLGSVDPAPIAPLLGVGAKAPIASDDSVRASVREVLRHGGYKPTGRGKPASEYLLAAAGNDRLGSINAAVDACNAASLHSGLPISVVDLGRACEPFCIAVAAQGTRYVFNLSGQEIDLSGLLCLFDAQGPSGSAVKDSQRTKTHEHTRRTLSVIWGSRALGDRTSRTIAWYRGLLASVGASTEEVGVELSGAAPD